MATNRTSEKEWLTGLIVPTHDWSFWEAESDVDWQSPYPGQSVPSRSSRMRLIASGTPEENDVLEVRAADGGIPGRYLWRPSGGTYRGWEPPCVLAGTEQIAASAIGRHGTMCSTTSGVVLFAHEVIDASFTGDRDVVLYKRDTDGTWSTIGTIVGDQVPAAATARYLYPRLLREVDGTIALYVWHYIGLDQDTAIIRRYQSLDEGTTWELAATRCGVEVDVGTNEVESLIVATSGDQWLMLYHTAADLLIQQASADGVKFTAVSSFVSSDGQALDCVYSGGFFLPICAFDTGTAQNEAYIWRLGTAFQAMTEANYEVRLTEQGSAVFPQACIFAEDSGRVWAFFEAVGGSDDLCCVHSDDAGGTWIPVDGTGTIEAQHIYRTSGLGVGSLAATFARGMGFFVQSVPTSSAALWCQVFGGSSTFANPPAGTDYDVAGEYVCDDVLKYPIAWALPTEDPGNGPDIAASHTGVPTISNGAISGGAGVIASWSLTSPSTAVRLQASTILRINDPASATTGSRVTLQVEVRPASAAATFSIDVEWVAGTGIEVRDTASASVLNTASEPATSFELKVVVDGVLQSGGVWYRLTSQGVEDREWTQIVKGGALTDNGGTTTDVTLTCDSDIAAAWDCDLQHWFINAGTRIDAAGTATIVIGQTQAEGVDTTWTNTWARDFSTRPTYTHDGVSFRARGIARRNDTWTFTPGATYHPSNVLVNVRPSPRHMFRSKASPAGDRLALQWNGGEQIIDHATMAVQFIGCNFRTCNISWYQGGAWTAGDTHEAFKSITHAVLGGDGFTLYPNSAGASVSNVYFRRNELAGCWWYDGTAATYHKIASNTEGAWDTGTGQKMATITLETAASAVTRTASQSIVYRDSVAIINLPNRDNIEGIRVTFSDYADTYIECGAIIPDNLLVFGAGPDQNRTIVLELGPELEEMEDGHAYIRSVMPTRRRVELGYARTMPLYQAQGAAQDYIVYDTGNLPAGGYNDAPYTWWGLIEERGRKPFVYLPRLDPDAYTGDTVTSLVGRELGILVRFAPETIRHETVIGHAETANEVVRMVGITLREVV